ncbi:MAG TPA: hypothetical protein VGS19_05355 [Streptosporangiaceae bacterium]|nr:hypothetical protein [Streptosporangiaceae bacterium]
MSPRKARRLPADVPRRPRGGFRPAPAAGDAAEDEEGSLRLGPETTESAPDGDWVVRAVPGNASDKTYRCPGCDQEVQPATPHLVVWPAYTPGVAERRHWHRPCWQERLRRRRGTSRPR